MPEDHPSRPWTEPGWLETVHSWIRAVLAQQGLRINGEIDQPHIRPWSTVLRVPTDQGTVYFKASMPVLAHEPALTQALYEWHPDCMVRVLAADLEKHWMLMADEGVMLRSLVHSPDYLKHWEHLLPRYAGIQIELAAREKELLELGVFDRRLRGLPAEFERLAQDQDALRLDRDGGLTAGQQARLLGLAPQFTEMCGRLAGGPIPQSLHHDDFHDGNIYIRGERCTFSDWGESCWTHPFFSMVVNLRSTAYRLDLPDQVTESPERFTPELNHLRDLYLEPWTRFAPLETLREIFSTAWRVGMVNRALTWHQVVTHSDTQVREAYGHTVPAWLEEFLLVM